MSEVIWGFLTSHGMTEEGASGMMGNLYAESGLISNRMEILLMNRYKEKGISYTDWSYTNAIDSGKISLDEFLHPIKPIYQYGYGLAQWTSPSRKLALYNYVKSKGVSIGDLTAQLEFLVGELQSSYQGVWRILTTSHNVLECSNKVLKEFEIPANLTQAIQEKRYGYSMEYYMKYAGKEHEALSDKIESYTKFAENIAADQSHGYSQESRWGTPDYDCSSLVISALEQAGIPAKTNGATYTGNMYNVLRNLGFKDVTNTINLTTGTGLQRGDILMYHKAGNIGHTAIYNGKGNIVHARGRSYGSAVPGDQGTEIAVTPYNNPGWQYVLRYGTSSGGVYMFSVGTVKKGTVNKDALLMQTLLRGKGYKGKDKKELELDGSAGENTIYALKEYQKKNGLEVDGVCGTNTWRSLIGL